MALLCCPRISCFVTVLTESVPHGTVVVFTNFKLQKLLRVTTTHGTVCYSLFLLTVLLITDLIVYQTISSNFITWHSWLRAGRPRGRGSSPGRVKNFFFSTSARLALGPTQPPIQWVLGSLSPGVKRQGREADHSPPASAEVKKMWIYTFTLPYAFMAWCLIS
jgi:hypothetical protein